MSLSIGRRSLRGRCLSHRLIPIFTNLEALDTADRLMLFRLSYLFLHPTSGGKLYHFESRHGKRINDLAFPSRHLRERHGGKASLRKCIESLEAVKEVISKLLSFARRMYTHWW